MLIRKLTLSILAGTLMMAVGLTQSSAQDKDQTRDQTQDRTRLQDPIYGSQLMTEQERLEHRNRMRSFQTQQEREAYQLEHHKRMQERAKAKGVKLPDEPMGRPGGMGPGGMGPGGR